MREREPRSQRAGARMTVASTAAGAATRSNDASARGARNTAQHRTKRPPPLPTRKAHKIKRIKAQRSTPWAALEPARSAGRDQMWLEHTGSAQRGRQSPPPAHPTKPARVEDAASSESSALGEAGSSPRWLLLLKVGKDDLAGIWDGRLASCEPIVWRPATKTWAPLFEVPQIATLVSATVRERQIAARSSQVPPSPAPRRHHPTGGSPAVRPPSQPPSAGPSPRSALPEQGTSLASPAAAGPAGRLTLRSPTIPPPPRVPQGMAQSSGLPAVHPAFMDDDEPTATVPAFALAPRRPSAEQSPFYPPAEPAAPARQFPPEASAYYTPEPAVREAEPSRGVDSYAPQAHTIAPLAEPQPQGNAFERAAWLLAGVAAALTFTTFSGVGTSLSKGMASRLGSEPSAALAAVADRNAASRSAENEPPKAEKKASDDESEGGEALSVEELPVLGKGRAEERSRTEADAESSRSHRAASGRGRHADREHRSSPAAPQREQRPAARAGNKFDAAAARRALASSVARAQYCAAERATGTVLITFSPTGSVMGASLANLQGDDVRKGCVVRAFRSARVTPFQGEPVTVQKSFRLR